MSASANEKRLELTGPLCYRSRSKKVCKNDFVRTELSYGIFLKTAQLFATLRGSTPSFIVFSEGKNEEEEGLMPIFW